MFREENALMQVFNLPVRSYDQRIEELREKISKGDGQCFSEREKCQVLSGRFCHPLSKIGKSYTLFRKGV